MVVLWVWHLEISLKKSTCCFSSFLLLLQKQYSTNYRPTGNLSPPHPICFQSCCCFQWKTCSSKDAFIQNIHHPPSVNRTGQTFQATHFENTQEVKIKSQANTNYHNLCDSHYFSYITFVFHTIYNNLLYIINIYVSCSLLIYFSVKLLKQIPDWCFCCLCVVHNGR